MIDIASLYSTGSSSIQQAVSNGRETNQEGNGFGTILKSAMEMVNETNVLQNNAEAEEINFAMGLSDNTHSLAVAQQKANVSLQYTVAVRDRLLDAYKEIMNIQI